MFYQGKIAQQKPLSRFGSVKFILCAIAAIVAAGFAANTKADATPASPSLVISIQEKTCDDADSAIHAKGVSPSDGNIALHIFGEDGNWHPVAHIWAFAGEEIDLFTTDNLVGGETVGVALTISTGVLDDSAVEVFELERRYVSLPSAAFCNAPITPVE